MRRARSSSFWWRAAEATGPVVIVIVLPWMRTISDGTAATTTTVVMKTATIRVVTNVTIVVIISGSSPSAETVAPAKLARAFARTNAARAPFGRCGEGPHWSESEIGPFLADLQTALVTLPVMIWHSCAHESDRRVVSELWVTADLLAAQSAGRCSRRARAFRLLYFYAAAPA